MWRDSVIRVHSKPKPPRKRLSCTRNDDVDDAGADADDDDLLRIRKTTIKKKERIKEKEASKEYASYGTCS